MYQFFPVINNKFCHNIVKVVWRSTRLLPCGCGQWQNSKFLINNKTDFNLLKWRHCSLWFHCSFSLLSADAPPHWLGLEHDGFPDGCPTGNDPLKACRMMVEKGIVLYCVGCEPSILRYKDFFMGLAYITGGQYVPLSRAQGLSKVNNFLICSLC